MLHGSAGTLLLAAAAGYWVLLQAQSQKKNLKRAGKFIGWTILVVSLVGVACRVWAITMCQTGMCPVASCPMNKQAMGKAWCPFTPKSSSLQPADSK